MLRHRLDFGTKFMRMEKIMARVKREMKEKLIETVKWSQMGKGKEKMIERWERMEKEENELKTPLRE